MTNTPDLTPTPESNPSATDPVAERRLDDGTFTELREPRAEARLALADGKWHQISPKYVWVQLISSGSAS